jgi:aspartyl-tRNA(Asn)/glutamyl-tRNA(Gln) amidotransferase subunit B
VDELVNKLPVLPDTMQARLRDEFKLSAYEADVLVNHLGAYEYFKEVVEGGRDAQDTAKWVVNDIFGFMNEKNLDFTNSPLTSVQLGQLMDLIATGKISGTR